MIPFFHVGARRSPRTQAHSCDGQSSGATSGTTLQSVFKRKSLFNFLLGSMVYRDALNALYAFGGVYATLVLDWQTIQIGVFGIIAALRRRFHHLDRRALRREIRAETGDHYRNSLILVRLHFIVGMSRNSCSASACGRFELPDIIFYICGSVIGGAGGALYAASRSMMVRHTHPERPTEAFGLFALTGKATAFLAPLLITIFTAADGQYATWVLARHLPLSYRPLSATMGQQRRRRAEWSASVSQ